MLTKYGISPWSDRVQESYPLQPQQITLPKTEPLKQGGNKLQKLSQKSFTDNQFVAFHKKNKKKLSRFNQNKRNLSKSISNYDFIEKSQLSLSINVNIKKKMSTQLFKPNSRFQGNLTSQRSNFISSHSAPVQDKLSQQKQSLLFQSQTRNNTQSLPYFFSLIQKQDIKFAKQKNKNSEQRHCKVENQEIFKSIDQISVKRKNQIKLPKITVAYSQKYF